MSLVNSRAARELGPCELARVSLVQVAVDAGERLPESREHAQPRRLLLPGICSPRLLSLYTLHAALTSIASSTIGNQ